MAMRRSIGGLVNSVTVTPNSSQYIPKRNKSVPANPAAAVAQPNVTPNPQPPTPGVQSVPMGGVLNPASGIGNANALVNNIVSGMRPVSDNQRQATYQAAAIANPNHTATGIANATGAPITSIQRAGASLQVPQPNPAAAVMPAPLMDAGQAFAAKYMAQASPEARAIAERERGMYPGSNVPVMVGEGAVARVTRPQAVAPAPANQGAAQPAVPVAGNQNVQIGNPQPVAPQVAGLPKRQAPQAQNIDIAAHPAIASRYQAIQSALQTMAGMPNYKFSANEVERNAWKEQEGLIKAMATEIVDNISAMNDPKMGLGGRQTVQPWMHELFALKNIAGWSEMTPEQKRMSFPTILQAEEKAGLYIPREGE